MLCGLAAMTQAPGFECLVFDPFSFNRDSLAMDEVNVGRRQFGDALVVAQMIVVADEVGDFLFEITRQIIVL